MCKPGNKGFLDKELGGGSESHKKLFVGCNRPHVRTPYSVDMLAQENPFFTIGGGYPMGRFST
jgi:hypothetical protein